MELKVISSSSLGNCYILCNETSALIIEAGVPFAKVEQALDFKIFNIEGCILTHRHLDHFKYANEYAKRGISIFCNENVFEAADLRWKYKFNIVEHNKTFTLGDFTIKPFNLIHDVPCFGFYIKHPETGNFIFATDTSQIPYRFGKLHNILIECNYEDNIIDTNETHYKLRDRVVNSHLSLKQVTEFLKMQDLSELNNLVLLHLSESNSNIQQYKREITKEIGHPVEIALPELQLTFNKEPF